MEKIGENYGSTTGNDIGEYMGLLNGTREVHAPKSKAEAYMLQQK